MQINFIDSIFRHRMYVCRRKVEQNQMCAFFFFLGPKNLKTSLGILQSNEDL